MFRKRFSFALIIISLVMGSLACQIGGENQPAGPSEADLESTVQAKVATQVAESEKATAAAIALVEREAAIQATETALAQPDEPTSIPPTSTPKPTATKLPLSTPPTNAGQSGNSGSSSSAEAASMEELIDQLYEDGYLGSKEGSYSPVDDFEESWAQMNWYKLFETDLSPKNFVIKADVEWFSASKSANWYNSGCGFTFRTVDVNNHYLAYLALDGNVRVYRVMKDNFTLLRRNYYGKLDVPDGSAQIVMIVDGISIIFLVNGKVVVDQKDQLLDSPQFAEGTLAYTLNSGTNKGFGTRCKMTNVGLWELEK